MARVQIKRTTLSSVFKALGTPRTDVDSANDLTWVLNEDGTSDIVRTQSKRRQTELQNFLQNSLQVFIAMFTITKF